MTTKIVLLGAALATVGAACGGTGGAAKAVRTDMKAADSGLGMGACMEPGGPAEPWTFDMDSTTRGALFAAMKKGAVVVSFDCKAMRVLTTCNVPGNYDYGGYPASFDVLDFKDSDSLKASLSGGAVIAAKFKGEMERGATLYIAHGEVGMSSTTVPEVHADQLKGGGGCKGATHFVSAVHFGAYEMKASSKAEGSAELSLLGNGTSGGSSSAANTSSQGGKRTACEKSAENDEKAPDECNTVVRVALAPIGPERPESERDDAPPETMQQASVKPTVGLPPPPPPGQRPTAPPPPPVAEGLRPPPPCGPGAVRIGGMCKKASGPVGPVLPVCRTGDVAGCTKQCAAGEPMSCTLLGFLYEKGRGVEIDMKKAYDAYSKACAKGNLDGCTGLGYALSKGGEGVPPDDAKAEMLLENGCKAGNGRACSGIGQRHRLAKQKPQAMMMFNRACKLGYARACYYAASMTRELKGPPELIQRSFERACYGRDFRGCLAAAATTPNDEMMNMGLKGLEKSCLGSADDEACEIVGDFWSGKYDPAKKNPMLAKLYYHQACLGGRKSGCEAEKKIKVKLPPPPPPRPPGMAPSGPPSAPPSGPPTAPPTAPPGPPKPRPPGPPGMGGAAPAPNPKTL